MVYICVICMATQARLWTLNNEHRKLLLAILSPAMRPDDWDRLKNILLLVCSECLKLVQSVLGFQGTALAGVNHLLSLLPSVGAKQNATLLQESEKSNERSQLCPINVPVNYVAPAAPASVPRAPGGSGAPAACPRYLCLIPPVLNGQPLSQPPLPKLVLVRHRPAHKAPAASAPYLFNDTTEQNMPMNQLNPNEEIDPLLLEVKNEPDNLIQDQPYVEMDKQQPLQEKLQLTTELDIKFEPVADCVTEIVDPLTNTTTVSSCQNAQTPSTPATVEREETVAVFTHRPAEVATGNPLLSCSLSAGDAGNTGFETHQQQKTPWERLLSSSRHIQADDDEQQEKMHSTPEGPYICKICNKKSNTKIRHKYHMIRHKIQKRYRCKQCQYSFSNPSELRRHAASHAPRRPHLCHLCDKGFTAKKSLTEHLSMHAGLRPHTCPLCPATFTYSAALYTHTRLEHLKVKGNWKKDKKENRTVISLVNL